MFNIIKIISQNDMKQLALTPKAIVENNLYFSIPIYQRLFTWNEEQVKPLMQDLLYNFVKHSDSHYHIGLLTSTANNDLVDGQQRFTVMTLIAIVFNGIIHSEDWHRFLLNDDNNLRLTYRARPEDEKFIIELINCQDIENKIRNRDFEGYVNEVMLDAINSILIFINQIDQEAKELTNDDSKTIILTDFSKYLFEHIAFFIQVLPEEYTGRMLNKHFEAMNSTGKNLEEHEILKVDLLKNVSDDNYNRLVTMWNACSDTRRTLFGTSEEAKYKRFIEGEDFSMEGIMSDRSESLSIRGILEGTQIKGIANDSKRDASRFYSFLTFPDFLLQVLYIVLKEDKTKEIEIPNLQRFFKQENLRDTFKTYWDYIDPVIFIEKLYKYRIIFDWAVIRIDGDGDYNLLSTDKEHSKLEQFEGMLFANSSRYTYYKWIPTILKKIYNEHLFDEDSMLSELKKLDNEDRDHQLNDSTKLDYESIDRYYFRRLDYYLWESIIDNGIDDKFNIVNKEEKAKFYQGVKQYRFHQYNSIEHLHPQHEDKQIVKWMDEEAINGFGNLALISGSFNSTQSDDSLNPKFGRIRDLIYEGRLESIKLTLMYFAADGKSENWTQDQSKKHGNEMIDFLKKTYS